MLADDKSNTLYVCSDDTSGFGLVLPTGDTPTALKMFDLKTGEPKGSVPLPGKGTLCNDIAVASDGAAYVADSFAGRILRLKPGAKEFEVWATDERWNVPGKPNSMASPFLATARSTQHLRRRRALSRRGQLRRQPRQDHQAADLSPSLPFGRNQAFGPNQFIQVEGETKGNLDLITIDGDNAKVETIKSGFDGPVGLTQVGDQIYVLDVPLRYLLGQEAKDHKAPPPFKATPVPAPK